jgi:DNA-binding response OmpR family regulator
MVRLRGVRVLIVEDEALVAMLIEDTVSSEGAIVLEIASSVEDAHRIIDMEGGDGVDLAILDINLLGESALTVADKLLVVGVPFIFATGYADAEVNCRHAAVPRLTKPYDPEELIEAIITLFKR